MRFADTGSGSYAIAITSPSAVSLRRALRFPTTALPEAVAVVQRKLLVTPLLSRPYQVEITYYQTVPPLVNDTDTNWLLDEAPDVYLYGMLYAFAQFLVDDARVPMWESAFITGMKELERARERREYGGAPLEFVNEYTF